MSHAHTHAKNNNTGIACMHLVVRYINNIFAWQKIAHKNFRMENAQKYQKKKYKTLKKNRKRGEMF